MAYTALVKTNSTGTDKKQKRQKFDYETMKLAATHADAAIRKRTFIEYFERFAEFPSYLFDNENAIDSRLRETIDDLLRDPESSKELRSGIELLLHRLPA